MKKPLHIAIDGPVAAGKGDIAARLAKRLGLVYLYTGAMYRALALACLRSHIRFKDAPRVVELLKTITIDLVSPRLGSQLTYIVLLNEEDITDRIMQQNVAMGSSDVATIPEVRQFMVERQKEMAKGKSVVMEGRDIGLRVLPQAQLKIYLTASLEERAKRRFKQWQERGIPKTFAETIEDTKQRDIQDKTRTTDPLTKLPDAWELDTTNLIQEEVLKKIEDELRKMQLL